MKKEKRYSIGWMLLLFFGAITIFSASSDARADEVTVQFERGRFEKTIQGSIRGDRYVDYIVGVAHPNQMLKVHMTASNPSNYFNVLPPTGETALFIGSTSGNDYEQRLIRPGNYRIRVYLMRNAARRNERSQYTIRIAVTGASGGAPGGGKVPFADVLGMVGYRAMNTMTSRGFAAVDTFTRGNTRYHIFHLDRTGQCVQMTMGNNRVVDIRDIQTHPRCTRGGGASGGAAHAMTPGQMMQECRVKAGQEFRTHLPNIDTKYEGRRVDGTHAVNGTAMLRGRTETFQCTFDRRGQKITEFIVRRNPGGATQLPERPSNDVKVPGTDFNATGDFPCARYAGQPLRNCKFGVKRRGNGNGSITVFWPDAGNRVIYFENSWPKSYDESQADAGARMRTTKSGDLFTITIGAQRFEIPEAVITGG